jgi:phosphoserine phosphatase
MAKLKLVVFDVDGTLIRAYSSWQHLHEALGTWDKGKKYAEQFFKGAITYEEWARLDARLWRGLLLYKVQRIIDCIPYTKGTQEVIGTLRKSGFKVILLSAGLSLVTDRIEREISIDYSLANELVVKKGLLTGEVKVNVSFNGKVEVLRHISERFGAKMDECAAVGDDETMIPLFKNVSLGIAFNPHNEKVEKSADVVVKDEDLRMTLPHLLASNV